MIDCAIVSPTPSMSASSCAFALAIACISPKVFAKACAAVGPTWRMESATITRQSGRDLASSRAASNFSIFFPALPSFLVKNSERINLSLFNPNRSDSSTMIASVNNAFAAS